MFFPPTKIGNILYSVFKKLDEQQFLNLSSSKLNIDSFGFWFNLVFTELAPRPIQSFISYVRLHVYIYMSPCSFEMTNQWKIQFICHKIDFVRIISEVLNLKGHTIYMIVSKVTSFFLKWILPCIYFLRQNYQFKKNYLQKSDGKEWPQNLQFELGRRLKLIHQQKIMLYFGIHDTWSWCLKKSI